MARKGQKDEARNILRSAHRSGPLYLIAVDELFGRQEAIRQASLSDQKILLDFQLFRSYLFSPTKLPFDLSATPNFARRLSQAGVDIK
ncbi:MAG: hypothetical protein U5K54_20775 [Cytophagales bacterium]|nr:hypothetical protein [Cytophagales bacterium]